MCSSAMFCHRLRNQVRLLPKIILMLSPASFWMGQRVQYQSHQASQHDKFGVYVKQKHLIPKRISNCGYVELCYCPFQCNISWGPNLSDCRTTTGCATTRAPEGQIELHFDEWCLRCQDRGASSCSRISYCETGDD